MAKIACIKDGYTYREDINNIDDIVVYVEDTHEFSDHEKEIFNIYTVKGTRSDVKTTALNELPEIRTAYLNKDSLTFDEPILNELGKSPIIRKELWKDGDDWKEIINMPKYKIKFNSLTESFEENVTSKSGNSGIVSISDVSGVIDIINERRP